MTNHDSDAGDKSTTLAPTGTERALETAVPDMNRLAAAVLRLPIGEKEHKIGKDGSIVIARAPEVEGQPKDRVLCTLTNGKDFTAVRIFDGEVKQIQTCINGEGQNRFLSHNGSVTCSISQAEVDSLVADIDRLNEYLRARTSGAPVQHIAGETGRNAKGLLTDKSN